MKKFFDVFTRFQQQILTQITGLIFIISTIVLVYQVFGRKIFGIVIPGYDQIILWLSIICVYLMMGLALKEGRHIRVTIVMNLIRKEKIKQFFELFSTLISICYVLIAIYATYSHMMQSKRIGSKAIMFNFPTWIVMLIIVISFLILLIYYFEIITEIIKNMKRKTKKEKIKEDYVNSNKGYVKSNN